MPPMRQTKLHHVRLRLRSSLLTNQFTVLFQEQTGDIANYPTVQLISFVYATRNQRVYRIAFAMKSTKTNFPRKIYICHRSLRS